MSAVWGQEPSSSGGYGKHKDNEMGQTLHGGYVADAEATIRNGFIRKVYGILSVQMVVTVMVACLFMFEPSCHSFVLSSPGFFTAALWSPLAILLVLACNSKTYPLNMYLLSAFTLAEAYGVGVICAAYQERGDGFVILQAFILTATVFVSLTAYTFITKKDFSFMGAGLYSCLWILIIWSLINSLFGTVFGGVGRTIFALAGTILFSCYILFDTSMIMRKLGPDEYVFAAINLYLDILNLFLYILELLGSRD